MQIIRKVLRRLRHVVHRLREVTYWGEHLIVRGKVVPEAKSPLPDTLPGGKPWPKISVVTPSFNQGQFIAETIESVLNQDYPNVEYIIIDGGSTDETMRVVDGYKEKLAHVISEADKGQSDAINKGFRLACGDIFCWLNSDDQLAPGALASVAMAFATNEVDIVSGICELYENDMLVHRHMSSCADGPMPLEDMLDLDNGWNAGQFFYQPEVFFSRALWEKAGSHVREDCFYSMDYELWCRFALSGAKLHVIGKTLAWYRVHAEQKTADPAKFKHELILVRDQFARTHGIEVQPSNRPALQPSRTLRVAMVNDLGTNYGAGIAHGRISTAISMAGHVVESFDLQSRIASAGAEGEDRLVSDVVRFSPDLVVFGNLHAATRDSVNIIRDLSERYPACWVAHDFWLFTGRCAFPGDCTQNLTGCTSSCPTAKEYPELAPEKIRAAWEVKQDLLRCVNSLYILPYSSWTAEQALHFMSSTRKDAESRISEIRLGAPTNMYRPRVKKAARRALGVAQDHFVIAFSFSVLSDLRKGGQYLRDALRGLKRPKVTVLLVGNLDVPFEVEDVEIVSLGYVRNKSVLLTLLSAADVYVGPSTAETFGQVFIEAALVGTPSIGFNQSGVRDAIKDGVTGLLVPQSSIALRDAILSLYNDRELCDALSSWSSIYARNEYSLEASYRSLFLAWNTLGLIDNWGLPHKISFTKEPISLIK